MYMINVDSRYKYGVKYEIKLLRILLHMGNTEALMRGLQLPSPFTKISKCTIIHKNIIRLVFKKLCARLFFNSTTSSVTYLRSNDGHTKIKKDGIENHEFRIQQ